MNNFEYYTPTRVFFGRDTHKNVGEIIKSYGFEKVLLHYGGGSIHKTGLYDVITEALRGSGISFVELGGAQVNPKVSLVREGAALCKHEGVEMVLAVGGGSVIDSAKVIAISARTDTDPWEFSAKRVAAECALPVGVVLTLSASGSETSSSAVITNEDGKLKRGFNSDFNRPLFAVMNPELTYTVDKYQTGCGVVDIMMHTLERYFSPIGDTELTDGIAEGLLKAAVDAGRIAVENPNDYEARANLMWTGSLSHSDLTGAGRQVFMTCHQIEHELSGMYDFVAHGAGLSVIFPAWCKYVCAHNVQRFYRYAVNVWNIEPNLDRPEKTAMEGILATERYFDEIGMPTRLSQLGVGIEGIEEMAEKCTFFGARTLPSYIPLGKQEIIDIFRMCE